MLDVIQMPAYESIFTYYDDRQQRGRCWLRLYQRLHAVVAVVSEVPGNTGATIPSAIQHLGTALVDRYQFNPRRLTLVSHYPPDSPYSAQGEYNRIIVIWLGTHFAYPQWRHVSAQDVQALTGERMDARVPFWRPQAREGWLRCQVGPRQGIVHPLSDEEWQAMVHPDAASSLIEGGFASKEEAQGWVLNQLAHLAAEYDTEPINLGRH
jgi:hypothetical protein